MGERLGLQQVLVVIDLHDGEQEGTDEVLRVLPFGVENLGAMPDEESLQPQQAPEAGCGLQAQQSDVGRSLVVSHAGAIFRERHRAVSTHQAVANGCHLLFYLVQFPDVVLVANGDKLPVALRMALKKLGFRPCLRCRYTERQIPFYSSPFLCIEMN